jgi:hypothetical protein
MKRLVGRLCQTPGRWDAATPGSFHFLAHAHRSLSIGGYVRISEAGHSCPISQVFIPIPKGLRPRARGSLPRAFAQNPVGVQRVPLSAPSNPPAENAEQVDQIPPDFTKSHLFFGSVGKSIQGEPSRAEKSTEILPVFFQSRARPGRSCYGPEGHSQAKSPCVSI